MKTARLRKKIVRVRARLASWWQLRWVRIGLAVAAVPAAAFVIAGVYYYVSFARLIDTRLHGERDRVLPRVFARPLELWRGQSLTERQLIDRLNDIGYAERTHPDKPGQLGTATVFLYCKKCDLKFTQLVKVGPTNGPARLK